MLKQLKKLSALALLVVFMTESVSAAGIDSIIHITEGAGSYITQGMDRFYGALDRITSGMAFDDITSGTAVDDIVSGQTFEWEAAENILNSNSSYSFLTNTEKRILNYVFGVREDTMLDLEKNGYSLKASVNPALIMQRMNFDVTQAEAMAEKLGENPALSQSLRFRNLQLSYGGWENNKFTAKNVASLMADGYNESEAVGLFIMSQTLNMSIDEIKNNTSSVNIEKPSVELETNSETLTDMNSEIISAGESHLLAGSTNSEAVVYNAVAENAEKMEIIADAEIPDVFGSSESIEQTDELTQNTPDIEVSNTENALNTEFLSDIAQQYGINDNILINYANENGLSAENIEDNILSKTDELGLSIATTLATDSDTDTEIEKDDNKLKGPFVAASGINDSINYTTGAVMYDENILSLPGVNGLDLNLSLHYDSSKRFRYDDGGSEVFKNDNEVWDLGFTRLTNELGGNIGSTFKDRINSIKLSDGTVYDLSWKASQKCYILEQAAFDNILVYKDEDASFKTATGKTSTYYASYIDGTREYFDATGNYMGTMDRFGNKIVLSADGNTTTITDSVGRTATISYAVSENTKTMTVTAPDNSSIILTFTKYKLNNYNYIWYLTKKSQTVGGVTLNTIYTYDRSCTYEIYSERSPHKKYREILLTGVTYPTGMTLNYEYGRGRTPGWNDVSSTSRSKYEYSRITRRYYNVSDAVKNDTTYEYTDTNYTGYVPEDYREREYTFGMTSEDERGLYTKYVFDENALNTFIVSGSNELQLEDNTFNTSNVFTKTMSYSKTSKTYEDEKIYNPNPTHITLKTNAGTRSEYYEYNTSGLVSAYYSPLTGNSKNEEYKTSYVYGSYGLIKSKTYKQNASTTIVESNTFTSDNCSVATNKVTVGTADKAETRYTYNDNGSPLTVNEYTDASNSITTAYTYYDNGMLKSETKGGVTQSYGYDTMGRVTKYTDGNNGETDYTYDTMGNVTSKRSPKGNSESYEYSYTANTINYIDAKSTETVYKYDPAGNLLKVQCGGDILAAYTYNASMLCSSETIGNSITLYEYDVAGRLTSATVANKNNEAEVVHKEEYDYIGYDVLCEVTNTIKNNNYNGDSKDIIETISVNACGWVTEKYNSDKNNNANASPIYKYEYDYLGNPTKVLVNTASVAISTPDSDYAATTYEYDYAGRVTKETDSYGNSKTYTYDRLGRKITERDKNNNASYFDYYETGNLKHQAIPLVESAFIQTWYTYDGNGNMLTDVTNNYAIGASQTSVRKTTYTYDADNNLTKATSVDNANGSSYTEYRYDANGNRTQVISANGQNAANYEYDKYNRVIKMTDPMGYVETYTYDIAGNMTSKKDRNGNIISYAYDPANRLTKEYSGNNVRAEYTYDMAGNRIIESNANVTVKSLYGSNSTLTKQSFIYPGQTGKNYEVCYSYDARKNVTSREIWQHNENNYREYESIQLYNYAYDNNNNMLAVKDSNAAGAHIYAAYTYDANGNLKTETFDNGIQNTYSYNKANLISGMAVKNGSTVLSGYTYTYYLDGNLQKNVYNLQGKQTKTVEYTYDNTGRLKTESATRSGATDTYSYTYDAAGNRSTLTATGTQNYTISYTYDKNNRLLKERKLLTNGMGTTSTYIYDKNGNMLIKRNGTIQPYTYANTDGQLGIYLESELPYTVEKNTYDVFNRLTGTSTDNGKTAVYKYYPNNLRLSKQVTDGSTTTYTGFMWDGSQTAAEFDTGFNLTNIYMFGRGQSRMMGTNLNTNVKTYYMYNPHGDVQGLTNTSGSLTKTYEYDAFGNEIDKVDTDTNPWRYCGEYYDVETDNIYLRNRYYSPATGRFINEDPIRSGGNWYSYCLSNPIKYIDENGLDAILANKPVDMDISNSIEHMGMFIQDSNNNWHFFYWGGDKVVLTQITDVSIFETPEKINQYLLDNGLLGSEEKSYRDFVYIKGDFSETYNKAVEDLKEYNNRGLEYRNPDKNPKYSLFGLDGSNCTQETIRLFSLGKLNNGETVDNYLKNNKFNASILPNKNMNVLQQLFYNKACNAREAEKDIKEAERDNETRVKNSNGYFYYINKKNLEAIS